MPYTARERFWLGSLALLGLAGLNGVFIWALVVRPELLRSAMANPVSVVFIVEAFVMTGVLAYFLARWNVTRVHWAWFVTFALVGGLAFALPAVLLWSDRGSGALDAAGGSIGPA